jgi:hypothetical protein
VVAARSPQLHGRSSCTCWPVRAQLQIQIDCAFLRDGVRPLPLAEFGNISLEKIYFLIGPPRERMQAQSDAATGRRSCPPQRLRRGPR